MIKAMQKISELDFIHQKSAYTLYSDHKTAT